MKRTEAALFTRPGGPLEFGPVDVDDPGFGEVRVEVGHVGLCHSDLHYLHGNIPISHPAILGHEVAGRVEQVGPGVTRYRPGDEVVVGLVPSCGLCPNCEVGRPTVCLRSDEVRDRGRPVFTLPDGTPCESLARIGGFARHILVREVNLARLPETMPSRLGCLLGCCVTTGMGAVLHRAQVRPGASVLVVGCGGVGSAIIQGARIAGAGEIIAADVSETKLNHARKLGATHTIDASRAEALDQLRSITPLGVEYAFEAVGAQRTVELAIGALRPGGTATVVGIGAPGSIAELPLDELWFSEKRIQGSYMGSSHFQQDVADIGRFHASGRLDLESMVSEVIPFSEINRGFADLAAGTVNRLVVEMPG